ncbi:MAG: pimeloyl-ACP methyl ester esterase BioH [Casimicrobiaceae bacterium]
MTLHVESVGAGAPLVLLHGWGLHAGFFAPLLPALAARYRVHAVDLPGHGHSPMIAPYTLDSLVDALAADVFAPLAGAGAHASILGWSFGGLLAQRLAHRYPQHVAQLLLVCTTPRFVRADDWPHGVAVQALRQFADELRVAYQPTLRRFLSLQMHDVAACRSTLATMRTQLAARPAADPAALSAALAILEGTDLRNDARAVSQRALVITGGRDTLTPAGAGAWLATALPAATLCTLADAAHIPFLTHAAPFLAALEGFANARR